MNEQSVAGILVMLSYLSLILKLISHPYVRLYIFSQIL